jgi:NAD(P)H dehydrogenase (quinone)
MSKPKVLIVIYTLYGHIYKMAQAVAKGAESAGAEVVIKQVPELLPVEVQKLMHAPPKPDIPIATVDELPKYDAIIFGCGTRYGGVAAQMKSFLDSTGQLWQTGALVNKVGGIFTGTGTQGGGQETTPMTFATHFAHHGMIFVPLGYVNPSLFNMTEIHGGGPWGAGTFSGPDGARQPTELELGLATTQGKRIADVAGSLKRGAAPN